MYQERMRIQYSLIYCLMLIITRKIEPRDFNAILRFTWQRIMLTPGIWISIGTDELGRFVPQLSLEVCWTFA